MVPTAPQGGVQSLSVLCLSPSCLDSPHPGIAMCLNVGAHRPIRRAEMSRAVSRLGAAGSSSPQSVTQELSAVQSSWWGQAGGFGEVTLCPVVFQTSTRVDHARLCPMENSQTARTEGSYFCTCSPGYALASGAAAFRNASESTCQGSEHPTSSSSLSMRFGPSPHFLQASQDLLGTYLVTPRLRNLEGHLCNTGISSLPNHYLIFMKQIKGMASRLHGRTVCCISTCSPSSLRDDCLDESVPKSTWAWPCQEH